MSGDRNFFTIIPANIRYDKAIPVGAKFLYSDISDLINQDGFCVAGDKYFMNTCQSSQATIQRWLTYLEKMAILIELLNTKMEQRKSKKDASE